MFRSKNSRAPWKEVAYVRHSTDPIAPLTSSVWFGPGTIQTMTVTTKDGAKHEIPVDGDGRVPKRYLYTRLLDEGSGSRTGKRRRAGVDMKSDSKVVHPYPAGGFTPQGIVETGWWQYPNESDVEGVDDRGASARMTARLDGYSKSIQGTGRKMVFLMPEASAERAWRILNDDFTATELRKAVKGGGLVIEELPMGSDAGRYLGRVHGSSVRAPVIELRPGWNEDMLVHEFVHLLRQVDDTRTGLTWTSKRTNADGERMPYYITETLELNSDNNLEEAATVAEATVRTRVPCLAPTGYYTSTTAHGDNSKARYNYDRALLVGDKPLKGRAAERRLKERFSETSISHLNCFRPGVNAIHRYEEIFPEEAQAFRKPAKSKSKNRRARYYGRYRAHYER